jgi:hypothetical protein
MAVSNKLVTVISGMSSTVKSRLIPMHPPGFDEVGMEVGVIV